MALVIENGSLVSGAVSFVTVAEARAYASVRAFTVPAEDAEGDLELEAALVGAADFLESLRGQFKGELVSPGTQALQWPRTGVVFEGYELPDDEIPAPLKNAQCQLAIEVVNGLDLMPTGDGREVIKEKVDVIEVEYAEGAGGNPQPIPTKARALLAPLLKTSQSSGTLNVIRR